MSRVSAAVVTLLDTQVADPGTHTRLRAQLAPAFDEEAKRRAGLS